MYFFSFVRVLRKVRITQKQSLNPKKFETYSRIVQLIYQYEICSYGKGVSNDLSIFT